MVHDISIKVDEFLKSNANRTQDQEKFKKEYDEFEAEHTKLKAEALESEIEWKIARKKAFMCHKSL